MSMIRTVGMIVAVATLASGSAAQEATEPAAADLAADVHEIRLALDRLVALQQTEEHHRRVELVLRRIELRVARLEPQERNLRGAQNQAEELESNLQQLKRMREQQEQRLQDEIREGTDQPHSDTRVMLDDINRSQKSIEERLEAVRAKAAQLEADLEGDRRQMEILDEKLDELLDEER